MTKVERSVRRRSSVVAMGALCLTGGLLLPFAAGARQAPPAGEEPRPAAKAQPGGEGRRGGAGMRREITDEDINRIVATARDIDPAWAEGLEAMRAKDPAELRQRIGTQSRMLIGLSWMRERQPELYKARVEDFRMQRQIRAAGERLKQAKDAGDAAAEAAALVEVREAAQQQFELDMKARAYELVAMEKGLKEARRKLQTDIKDREARLNEVVSAVQRGESPKFGRMSEVPMSMLIGGEGAWPRREGGEPKRPADGSDRPEPPPKP